MNRTEGCLDRRSTGRHTPAPALRPAASRLAPLFLVVAAMLLSTTGCLIPIYSGDPIRRSQQLIFTSEDLRAIADEWERIWFLDQPSHMTPFRARASRPRRPSSNPRPTVQVPKPGTIPPRISHSPAAA